MKTLRFEKCPCGACADYHITNFGKFVQGSGFTAEEVKTLKQMEAKANAVARAITQIDAEIEKVTPIPVIGDDDSIHLTDYQAGIREGLLIARMVLEELNDG